LGNSLKKKKKRKACWISHNIPRKCLQKQVIEGKIEEKREVTGKRRRRRHMQLLDEIKETRAFWNLKEEALDRTLWRSRFGRGYGPVTRQIIE
jgi:hypothetical protein